MKDIRILLVISVLSWPTYVWAQSYPTGVRTGVGSGVPPVSTNVPQPSVSTSTSAPRNTGTGQVRNEGAFGMSPQLQKELGIGRQQ